MNSQKFKFGKTSEYPDMITVSATDLHSKEHGYGFVTENNRNQLEYLQILELNSGFEPLYWLKGEDLTHLVDTSYGVSINHNSLPLIFKAAVPIQGNYHISVTITASDQAIHDVIVFAGRRRLVARKNTISPGESFVAEAVVNICDIIPRGKTKGYSSSSLDIAILADHPTISELKITKTDCPTIYIAGDSTLTDQSGSYPYDPGCCYCGWAQMLPYFLNTTIAVSNHAHSGLTTESFREEGHYDIIRKNIKPGDYFFLQFAHNDQKLPHLTAEDGYAKRIRSYIGEMRELGAIPVIVTPLARNTWKSDGSYNDLLINYADICHTIGKELSVPVLDLHEKSKQFVTLEGVESSARYYFPKDYTHSNDYGGFLMAEFIADACLEIPELSTYVKKLHESQSLSEDVTLNNDELTWTPPQKIVPPTPPANFKNPIATLFPVNFSDIEESPEKEFIAALTESGILSNVEDHFRPKDIITRVEALDWIIKSVRFVPTNVYNDHYADVIGHEWYAGIVETACQNDIVNGALTNNGLFHPHEEVTTEQLISFCITSYKCRKPIKENPEHHAVAHVSPWAQNDINEAAYLHFIREDFQPQKKLLREDAVVYIKKLIDFL